MLVGVNMTRTTGSFGFYHDFCPDEETLVKAVAEFAKLGIKVLELNVGIAMVHPEWVTQKTVKGLIEIKNEHNMKYTIHLPFNYLDVSALVESFRKVSVSEIKKLVKLLSPLNPEHYVLHLTNSQARSIAENPHYPDEIIKSTLDQMSKQASKSVLELLEVIEPKKLCIENLDHLKYPVPCFEVIQEHNTSMCYDVGHALKAGLDSVEFYEEHKDYISHIHFHDIVKQSDELIDHCGLGEGIVDKKKFLNHLKDTGYDGILIIEVGRFEQAVKSIEYLKKNNVIACGTEGKHV